MSAARIRAMLAGVALVVGFVPPAATDAPVQRQRAAELLRTHGCIHCHAIDGVTGANGRAGPPLHGLSRRVYIAGRHPNTLDSVARFILDPKSMSPDTAMPRTVDDEADARAIAAYLYELDRRLPLRSRLRIGSP